MKPSYGQGGKMKMWDCKIGDVPEEVLPSGADLLMRKAVSKAYLELTGKEPNFLFSGWGCTLTEDEFVVVEEYHLSRQNED